MILVGRAVARAFGLSELPLFEVVEHRGARVSVIPHPSGLNRQYNDPSVRRLAAEHLREALDEAEAPWAIRP